MQVSDQTQNHRKNLEMMNIYADDMGQDGHVSIQNISEWSIIDGWQKT